jgi:hypothetical protein
VLKFGERCSTITNRTKFATSSLADAVNAIDLAIANCETQVNGLEARGKTHLPSYRKCADRLQSLRQKRSELSSTGM